MNKLTIVIIWIAMLCLAGCWMTNEEVVKEKNICLSWGMDYKLNFNWLNGEYIGTVKCVKPKETK